MTPVVLMVLSAFWSVLEPKTWTHKRWAMRRVLMSRWCPATSSTCIWMCDALWALDLSQKGIQLFLNTVLIDFMKASQCPSRLLTLNHWLNSLFHNLSLLLAGFNITNRRSFCNGWASTHMELDGLMVCTSHHTNVRPPMFFISFLQIRVSHGRWSLLRTWWCWGMRRPCSTASSLLCRLPNWSGTTRMSFWQTSLGLLKSPLLLFALSSYISLAYFLPSPCSEAPAVANCSELSSVEPLFWPSNF